MEISYCLSSLANDDQNDYVFRTMIASMHWLSGCPSFEVFVIHLSESSLFSLQILLLLGIKICAFPYNLFMQPEYLD